MLFVLRLVLHVMVHLGLRSGSFSSNSEVVLETLVFISQKFLGEWNLQTNPRVCRNLNLMIWKLEVWWIQTCRSTGNVEDTFYVLYVLFSGSIGLEVKSTPPTQTRRKDAARINTSVWNGVADIKNLMVMGNTNPRQMNKDEKRNHVRIVRNARQTKRNGSSVMSCDVFEFGVVSSRSLVL